MTYQQPPYVPGPGQDPYSPQPAGPPVSGPPAGYPPGPYAPTSPGQPIYLVRPNSGSATASLVLGIIGALGGWCMIGIPCLFAILLGHQGLRETRDGTKSGHGQAVAGLILGYLCIAPWAIVGIMYIIGAASGAGS